MENISKSFKAVKALKDVYFSCDQGEVMGVAGENGAGKSTLVKIITGLYQPDNGKMFLWGDEVGFNNPSEGQEKGIAMVYQELTVLPYLTVGENIFLNREPRTKLGFIDNKMLKKKTEELLDEYEINLSPDDLVLNLSIAEQQMVEILKILVSQPEIIIFDEPTSALAKEEVGKLYNIINKLKNEGKSVIFISHRIEELLEICDRVTILKDGEYVETVETENSNKDEIISLMIGRSLEAIYPSKHKGKNKGKIFEVQGLEVKDKLFNISFSVNRGEIIGIAGLEGNGQTELLRCLSGILPKDNGYIYIDSERANINNPSAAIKSGITLIPADRKTTGLLLSRSVRENISLASLYLRQIFGFINRDQEKGFVLKLIDDLNIKTPNMEQEVGYLSGGNQQKVVLAKNLGITPKVLLFNRPTRGIDVEAKQEFYQKMRGLSEEGVAVIMSSTDLMEVIGMSDRVIVMYEGKIAGEVVGDDIIEENIMKYAVGES